jgi:exosortase A-associated hydrolase 1
LNWTERALVFACDVDKLVGVVTVPERPAARGVLIVVGGPQYRVGSHRQFTLLARDLAEAGFASLRFDYRGMGDSSGEARSFEHIEADIRSAIDQFMGILPAVHEVVVWGLCGAASAALFYAPRDSRVGGLVLLNPWVRTEEGIARVRIRHYYAARLLQASFWQKVLRGKFNVVRASWELGESIMQALQRRHPAADAAKKPLHDRMENGLRDFRRPVLIVLSGDDYTAQEFKDLVFGSTAWQTLLRNPRVTQRELGEANHTFARREWRDQVARWTIEWLMQSPDSSGGSLQAAVRSASSPDPTV